MNKYLKFEYWHTCDLGLIYYQGGQKFTLYLDGDVGEPFHEDVEDGQENGDGDFIPTYRKQMKRYRIRTSLVSDYLVDAVQRMKLHDNIEITFKSGEIERIYNLDVEPEWQFEKYLHQATMVLTFDMDESVTLGACCENLVLGSGEVEPDPEIPEPEPIPDLYWVAENGSNATGDGTYARPWATLAYACSQATTAGDVIHVRAGTIVETAVSYLAARVSIVGAGDTSIIRAGAALNPMIELASTSEGTDGNQSISYLKLDGDLVGIEAMRVYLRKNVILHHVTVIDFVNTGIDFRGNIAAIPVIHATGNQIYNCTFTNTTARAVSRGAAIVLSGQSGISIHDNTITGYQRALGHDPTLVSIPGYCKGMLFYNNTLNMDRVYFAANGTTPLWGFHMECWDCEGGYQVYNNTFNGGHCPIDCGGTFNVKGTFAYSWDIHHNTWQWSSQYPTDIDGSFTMVLEGGVADIKVHHNHFKNTPRGITCSIGQLERMHENVYIYYNIMENIGWGNDTWGFGIWISNGFADSITRNINIFNNVISAGTGAGGSATGGIMFDSKGAISDVTIRNNIIQNIVGYGCIGFWDSVGTIDDITIQNNILYNNVNTNDFYYRNGKVVTNQTYSGDIEDNPDFVDSANDFHLQAGSPAINAGLAIWLVGTETDYDGVTVSHPPEIGAYEY